MKELIIKKLDNQISHCKDCQDTDGQLKGFIQGLQCAKKIVAECANTPTTAEMLLFLTESPNVVITSAFLQFMISVDGQQFAWDRCIKAGFYRFANYYKTKAEAIQAAYNKEQK